MTRRETLSRETSPGQRTFDICNWSFHNGLKCDPDYAIHFEVVPFEFKFAFVDLTTVYDVFRQPTKVYPERKKGQLANRIQNHARYIK